MHARLERSPAPRKTGLWPAPNTQCRFDQMFVPSPAPADMAERFLARRPSFRTLLHATLLSTLVCTITARAEPPGAATTDGARTYRGQETSATPGPSVVDGKTNRPGILRAEPIDARSMGVVCDGATDNASIFDAITAKTASFPGQTVFFPRAAQPCVTSRPLVATSQTIYVAEASTVIIKPTTDSAADPVLFQASHVADVQVQGITFDGAHATARTSNNVAMVYQSARVMFDHVTVQNARGIAIMFSTGVGESGVRDSRFVDVGNHWRVTGRRVDQQQGVAFCCGQGNKLNFVTGSVFDTAGLDAISFTDQSRFVVSCNRFRDAGGGTAGVLGAGFHEPGVVPRLNGGAAIYGAQSNNVEVRGNVTEGAGGNGIDLYRVSNATISGNSVRRSGGNGISFAAASDAWIIDNISVDNNQARLTIISAPQAGIFLSGGRDGDPPVTDVVITGNTATDDQVDKTQSYGVQIQDGSSASRVVVDHSNCLSGNKRAAFGEMISGNSDEQEYRALPRPRTCSAQRTATSLTRGIQPSRQQALPPGYGYRN